MKILSRSLLCLITLTTLIFPLTSSAITFELSGDFGYDRTVYGADRENRITSRSYSAGLSAYVFDYTAIDLNASRTNDITSVNTRDNVGTNLDIVGRQDRVESNVFGIGIKQMFAPRTARLIPGISVGYAKQFQEYSSDITAENTVSKVRATFYGGAAKQRIDSVFASFSLQLRMTERLSLRASARTLFPAFDLDKARDTVKYSAGFAWIF
jgi:hypothetical protein